MILSSINKQAPNTHTHAQLPALPYNLIVPEPSSVSRTINPTPSLHPQQGCALFITQFRLLCRCPQCLVQIPNPRPPPFVTYRQEESQMRCRRFFLLTAKRANVDFASSDCLTCVKKDTGNLGLQPTV